MGPTGKHWPVSNVQIQVGYGMGVAMVGRGFRGGSFLLLSMCFLMGSLSAQTPTRRTPPSRLRVFIDCQYECDTEYLRQNIEFIEYVRDRAAADLHLLVTTQETGGGGMAWRTS